MTEFHTIFIDSIYTERYMKSVKENQKGYDQSSVHVTKGFDKVRYLLMHGTGDGKLNLIKCKQSDKDSDDNIR